LFLTCEVIELTKSAAARKRIEELLKKGHKSVGGEFDKGALSRADFDELHMLSDLLGNQLPVRFHDILKSGGSPSYSDDQRTLTERLFRILSVAGEFGDSYNNDLETELSPVFQLSEPDHHRVTKLCSDMRKIIIQSQFFDEPHKRRLLNRVAAIEQQVHQPKGKLDVILAGVVDVGDALGNFGESVKPLSKRIQEIAGIAKRSTKQYEQLPSPEETQSLPSPEQFEDTSE